MRHATQSIIAASLLGTCVVSTVSAQVLSSRLLVNTLRRPVFMTQAPGDPSRFYIVEKQGFIRIYQNNTLQSTATPFLNIDALVGGGTTANTEQGFLGLAFHPDYQNNGKYYVNYITNAGNTQVDERYRSPSNPNASTTVVRSILSIPRNAGNHLGGWLGFGPDGFLYISSGDSGGGCDPENAAQNPNQRRGKILRVNVDADDLPGSATDNFGFVPSNPYFAGGGDPSIWLTGLRNPWRPSFDSATGDFWIADVGQNQREEINFVASGSASTPIRNFSWPFVEGDLTNTCSKTGVIAGTRVDPFHVYDHGAGCSITGGYVYRGQIMPSLRGTYFFADYCTAKVWSLRYSPGAGKTEFRDRTTDVGAGGVAIGNIVSFAQDLDGEVYIIDQGSSTANGAVWRITRRCVEDLNASRAVDDEDFVLFAGAYTLLECTDPAMPANCPADFTKDGFVDDADFVIFAEAYDLLLCQG